MLSGRQVALVIGNGAYRAYPALVNPVNDARALGARLTQLHFDVTVLSDADRKAMSRGIDQWIANLRPGDVALFYYSGHGVAIDGENYMLPVDFDGRDEADVRYDSQAASRVQEQMESRKAKLNILILDACRDNPFRSSKGGTRGLAGMNAGRGTFIALATSPGKTASDNPSGRNGLFTQYLLEAMAEPGVGLNDVFDLVREKVDGASAGKQLPWIASSVVGRYSFVAAAVAAAPSPTIPAKADPPGVWRDPSTGLMWPLRDSAWGVGWAQADHYCKALPLAGYRDWRLPTIAELRSIYTPSLPLPHVKGGIRITDTKYPWVWSSEEAGSSEARGFDFGGGEPASSRTGDIGNNAALCVRRARE